MDKNEILKILKDEKSYIKNNFGIKKIGLFGSYIKSKQNDKSDIDIYVEFEYKSYDNLAGLWNYLEELYNSKVDIFHKHKNNNPLILQNIQKEVIYG